MERHTRLSRAAVVLVAIALIASIAAAVWFASPDAPYVPSEDSGAALGAAAPAEDGTVASGYQPSGTGISDETDGSAIQTIRNSKNGTYHLTKDIVVNSLTDCTFSGILDGNGKTISIQYDSEKTGEPDVDPTYVGIGALFGNLDGATIKNVKIVVKTFRYVEGSAGTRNVGIIAGDAWGGAKIENVYVELQYSPTSDGRSYFLDSGEHGSWPGINVELNFGAVLGKSGYSEDAATDVTLKNVTVDNQTSGDYGFSAWIRHGDYCNYKVSMGHFVGWVTGELSMQNCTLRGGESAKMTIKRGGSGGSTTNQSGAVIGRLDEQSGSKPSLTIAGLDMEMAINFDDHAVMNNISGNNGIIYGNDAGNSWTVNVQDIYWNQNSGNPGWYDGQGDDTITYSNLTKYDPNVIDISFDKDGDKVLLSAKAQYVNDASSIVNQIVFNGNTYTVWDKLIAADADTVGQWMQVVTVAKPKSNTGGNITFTKMGTGTFSIEGGETITGVSGNSYTAEREYDGNVPQSPSVVLSNNGGSYADVWKTTSASANVGKYTMTFDKNAFTDAVVATGSDELTYIARNGIVYSPGSMEQIGKLNIVNNINVNITQASVTVTPNVPDDDLYTGNRMPALTATAVDSSGSPVEGSIEWDEPDATLSSGTNSYAWTWKPNSDNYQTVTGSMPLEAFDRKIVSLTVQGDFKTKYIAYEPFDPRGVEVIAHYSDGSSEQLVNDEYEFTVMNGDKNRLIVKNDTVTVSLKKGSGASTTISITVSKLAVDVPTANQGLFYNGSEQTGVKEGGHYTLSGNTGTNAADYTATAELTDSANTRWDTADADDTADKEIKWSIAKKDVDIMEGHTSKTYDGQKVEPTTLFTAQGVNNEELALTVTVDGGKEILNAGTYTVTASLAESENYTAEPETITYTVNKKLVSGKIVADDLVYDGTDKGATFNGQLIGEDKVEIKYAGDRKNVTEAGFTATAELPSDNYAWADDAATSATFMILPKEINVTATTGSKEFAYIMAPASDLYELFELDGEAVNAEDKLIWKVDGKEVDMSGNVPEIFDAKDYKIEIVSADPNYTLVGTTSTTFTITVKKVEKPTVSDTREFTYNGGEQGLTIAENAEYTVTGTTKATDAGDYSFSIDLKYPRSVVWSDGTTAPITVKWKINKATFESVTIEFAEGALDNLFTSSAMPTPTTITATPTPRPEGVEGKFAWVESSLSEGKKTYHWTYTVPNYNVFEGTQELTAQAARLDRIKANEDYKKDYTAFDFFDVDSLVVTAYFDNGNGEESRVLSSDEYTLQSQSNIAQEGVPQLFVGDTYVIVTYQDKSVQIPVTVTAKVIELPEVIAELTYTGEPQTPFDWRGAGYESYIAFFEELSSYSNCDPSIVLRTDAGDFAFTLTINDALGNNVVFENGQKTFEVASKILPKRVYLGHGNYTWEVIYNGNAIPVADLGGNTGDDKDDLVFAYDENGEKLDIVFDYVASEENGLTSLVDAGEYTITFSLADSVVNYVADAYTTTLAITPMSVEATLTEPDSVVYTGKEIKAILTVTTTLVGEDKVTVEYNDVDRFNYTGEEIVATAQLPSSNYVWADGTAPTVSFTIQKATIDSVTVTISEAPGGVWTTAMMPEFISVNVEPDVEGKVVWDNDSLIAGENVNQPWTFVPDSPNYEPYHGSVKLTVVQATLVGVSVEVVKTTEYVAFDAFDRSSIVVKALYGEGPKEITGYTLTFSIGAEDRLLAGTGITVTVTYTDGGVTQYTEFTINVAKRTVAKPVPDTTVFDATGETITLPIAASEYYTVEGNTAIDPGRYVATVELKDPVNTMWEDGSTEDVKIAWTISEPVTSDEVIADILAMEKVTWQNAEEFLDLEARYGALDASEKTAEATAKLATLRVQYDALRASALGDIKAAHKVTAKSLGKALAAAAAGLSAAAIALAIAKRRSI